MLFSILQMSSVFKTFSRRGCLIVAQIKSIYDCLCPARLTRIMKVSLKMRSFEGPFLLSVSSKVVFIIRVQSSPAFSHRVIMSYSATSSISLLNPKEQQANLNNLFSYIININISITVIINTSRPLSSIKLS